MDYLEKVAVVKGLGGNEAKEWALNLYNQFQESKTSIDTFSDNRTGNKYSEWNDEERISANMMFQAFGLKTNEEIFKLSNSQRR